MSHLSAVITEKFVVSWRDGAANLADDRIRLRTQLSGISAGTEGMRYDGSAPALKSGRRSYPYMPGYELVGIVEEIGSAIASYPDQFPRLSSLKKGDRVFAFKPHASIADISENDLWVVLEASVASEDALALALACTSLHAIHRVTPVIGDDCAIVGLGVLGLIMVQMMAAAGSGRLVTATRSPSKSALATQYGATEIVDTSSSAEDTNSKTLPQCNIVMECSGTEQGLGTAVSLAGNQGRIGAAGFYTDVMPLSGEQVFAKELTLFGVRASGANGSRSEFLRWPRTENLKLANTYLHDGKLGAKDMITHRFEAKNLEDAYKISYTKSEPYLLMVLDWPQG